MLLARLNCALFFKFLQHPTSKVLHSVAQCTKCLSRCPLHLIPVFPRLLSLRYLQRKRSHLFAPFRIDLVVESWDVIKDDPNISDMNRGPILLVCPQFRAFAIFKQVLPLNKQTSGKAIKEGIDRFSEVMPVLMNALDELRTLHPFIGGELSSNIHNAK
jgi:hypothetical protein